jgi:UDP-N-acetylmuramoylalanine--D-glutamate ligase
MPRPTIEPDALSMGALRHDLLRERPVTVLGLARSGIALARFLADAGARVTVYDGRPAAELAGAIAALEGRSVTLALGPDVDPASTWADAALVTTSPSINPDYPTTEPRLRSALAALVAARASGDVDAPALVSEPDLFLRLCVAPTIGITGTKGKTTTASLTAEILAADPAHPVVLGGNIGIPLLERLAELTPEHRVVYELSELQLPTLSRGTTVAVYTNVTSDHLDRHGSLAAYRAVKRGLAELVAPDGALVLNAEDPVVADFAGLGTARAVLYRRDRPLPGGVGVVDGWIVAADVERLPLAGGGTASTRPDGRIMPVDALAIPGAHNVSNALAAVAVGLLFGVVPEAMRAAAEGFTGVEHRLEPVAIIDGVRFINDSQGTQPDAVIAALRAFEAPVVLIAGGRDKGVDLNELAGVVAKRAAAAVLIGETGPDLERRFRDAGLERIERAGSMDEAVTRADALAREALDAAAAHDTDDADDARSARPDRMPLSLATVLLSPAAASFDMFPDYAARGRAFKSAVAALALARAGRDR